VAYDKKVVSAALSSKEEGWNGASWIEKIVQVSFDIPLPSAEKIQELFVKKLNELIEEVPEKGSTEIEQYRQNRLYTAGIQPFLKTPRHVIRLINALSLTLPPIIKEVNIADFVALETLRLFCPLAYDTIRREKDYFIKTFKGLGAGKTEEERRKQFHQGWLSQIDEMKREIVSNMVGTLFPEWGGHYGQVTPNRRNGNRMVQ
jgi:predicted KAP-like P-loop ATPase